jgi:hypothetical protein
MSGGSAFFGGVPNPIDDGLKISEPANALFPVHFRQPESLARSRSFRVPPNHLDYPIIIWFDEDLKNMVLKDRLELLVPQPEYLTVHPMRILPDPETETLAPIVTFVDKAR